jgi:predicted ribosome quality control (RQC) complex YloA/Tae2 family protein
VALAPIPLAARGVVSHPASWREAASLFLELRRRGDRFEARRRRLLEDARRELRRLTQLEAHLGRDRDGLADPETLRRRAEALLASPRALPAGAAEADVPDPYASGARLRFAVDPALSAPANADRFFQKARRLERAREEVSRRLAETADALAAAAERTERAAAARDLAELAEAATPDPSRLDPRQRGGPRHYLTSRGLSLLVGRGARENHRLTFALARPEDLWLHAREVPGAHVILRDNEGRASSDDFREAAEVAAFFSEACAEAKVDVHVTRRKHVRPARGGPGRVHVNHSDTLCVTPRDPEGRLRRR